MPISVDLAIGLYSSLYYRTSRDDGQPALCYLECDHVMAEVVKHDNNIQAIVLKVLPVILDSLHEPKCEEQVESF